MAPGLGRGSCCDSRERQDVVHDGPEVVLWDALAVAAWSVATGLIVADLVIQHGEGMGPLAPFGGLVALAASVLTVAGIARRAKEEILEEMHHAFDMGRASVRKMH